MGIVVRQATKSAIYSYIGAILGFANVTLFMTRWFSVEEFGLRSILLDISLIFVMLSGIGTPNSLVKFFPYFNRNDDNDGGLLSIGLIISFLGFCFFGSILLCFQDAIINSFNKDSIIFSEYFLVVYPLSLFILSNTIIEGYIRARSNIAFTTFVKEIGHRVIILALLILFYFEVLSFSQFIIVFVLSYALNSLLYLLYLKKKRELFWKIDFSIFSKRVRKIYFNYSLFSILSGLSNLVITKIDTVMIGFILGLSWSAVYINSVYLTSLLYIPAIAIGKISAPLIAKAWKERRIDDIELLYQKSSSTQLLIGGILFVVMYSCIDNFYMLQKEEYEMGKQALLFLGLSKIISMAFGVNGLIVSVSKYYRFDTITSILLALLTITTNIIAIPIYGINGGAMATLVSLTVFHVSRYLFVKRRLNIQPFTSKTLGILGILFLIYFTVNKIPFIMNIYIDTFVRAIVIISSALVFSFRMNLSEELTGMMKKLFNQ